MHGGTYLVVKVNLFASNTPWNKSAAKHYYLSKLLPHLTVVLLQAELIHTKWHHGSSRHSQSWHIKQTEQTLYSEKYRTNKWLNLLLIYLTTSKCFCVALKWNLRTHSVSWHFTMTNSLIQSTGSVLFMTRSIEASATGDIWIGGINRLEYIHTTVDAAVVTIFTAHHGNFISLSSLYL